MEKEDLKQIREIVEEESNQAFQDNFSSVWESNLGPALEDIHKKISALPDKSYLDNRLAYPEGNLVVKLRKEDEKVNRLIEILEN